MTRRALFSRPTAFGPYEAGNSPKVHLLLTDMLTVDTSKALGRVFCICRLSSYQSFIYSNVMKRLVIIRLSQKTRRRNRRRRFRSEKQARRARPGQIPARRPHSRVSSAPAGRTTPGVRKVSAGWPDRWASLRENPTGATRTGARPT